MAYFGPFAAEIVSLVWGAPANFNGFRILLTSLFRGPVNQSQKWAVLTTPPLSLLVCTS